VLANNCELAGKVREPPASMSVGATSWTWAFEAPMATPAQFWIHVVIVSAHAWLLASQQWWPPPTLATIFEFPGFVRSTTVCAAWYARLTSSLRANIGLWLP
jgi:hypothetical protein